MKYTTIIILASLGVFPFNLAIAKQTCGDVYANAVRNISVTARQFNEEKYLFAQHCSARGELSSSSSNSDLSLVAKKITFGFSGSKEDAKKIVNNFCKEFIGKDISSGRIYDTQNVVVVDALRSLNECRALEINNVNVWYAVQEPRSVIIGVDFNPAKTKLFLRAVTYDSKSAECRTTGLSKDGKPTLLNDKTSEQLMEKPFSIVCERKNAQFSNDGAIHYPRFAVGVDTNYGAYTVSLADESVLGFDLANLNKQRYDAIERELEKEKKSHVANKQALSNEVSSWKNKYNATGVGDQVLIEAGEYNQNLAPVGIRIDPRNGSIQKKAAEFCANKGQPITKIVSSRGGGCCGYTYGIVSCLKGK